MRRRALSFGLPIVLVLGAGVAGADTVPERRVQDGARLEPPTVMDLLEVPIPGPTSFPEEEVQETEAVEEDDIESPGDEPNENASHGKMVSEAARDDSFRGCEKGRHVSEIASSNSQGRGRGRDERPPCPSGGPPPWAGGPPPWAGGPPPGAGPPNGP